MRKLLLLFLFTVVGLTAKAVTATIYVKADKAPYLYSWYNIHKDIELLGKWPGTLLTEKVDVPMTSNPDSIVSFWKMQISTPANVPAFHIIFNDGGPKGDGNGAKQTRNISNINTDRYFTYDGANTYTDISNEMGVVVPDAEITTVALLSKVFGNWDVNAKFFDEVEKNKTYQTVVNLTNIDLEEEEDCFVFEIFVNGSAYLGYNSVILDDTNNWMEEDKGNDGDNILIDLAVTDPIRCFLLTASWVQGKYIEDNWTLRIEATDPAGINTAMTTLERQNNKSYSLTGQRVGDTYKGIVLKGGKKVLKK